MEKVVLVKNLMYHKLFYSKVMGWNRFFLTLTQQQQCELDDKIDGKSLFSCQDQRGFYSHQPSRIFFFFQKSLFKIGFPSSTFSASKEPKDPSSPPFARCFKITAKVTFNIASEASYVYKVDKSLSKKPKMVQFGEFLKS